MLGLVLAACGGGPTALLSGSPSSAPTTNPSTSVTASTAPSASPSGAAASDAPSQPPDTGGSTTAGDVPDNAVFLTYTDAAHGFSVKYVEGWQVTTGPDGVVVHDKDSSATVAVVPSPSDVKTYISGTDLPALGVQAGFKLLRQDVFKVGTRAYDHVAYDLLSPPDPVTGKQVPSILDRYYVPGAKGLAVVTLSTPVGVDNVDAFRLMIESFKWS
jgi:hypothetical protein